MTDDITRIRIQRGLIVPQAVVGAGDVSPQPKQPRPRRTHRRTHAVSAEIGELGSGRWMVLSSGLEPDMLGFLADLDVRFAGRRHRIQPIAKRTKGWSVRDADHVPIGSCVMLHRSPDEIHPSMVGVRSAFGLSKITTRRGVVRHRFTAHRGGGYMVLLDGSKLQINVARIDIIYPVPAEVVDLDPARRIRK